MFKRIWVLLIAAVLWAETPKELTPPKDQQLLLKLKGKGNQIYICENAAWVLKGPDAQLLDATGHLEGRHFVGPRWQLNDGSLVLGKMAASVPSPDADSIPWLLVAVVTHEGEGVLAGVQSIQRLNTKGGKAPAGACAAKAETPVAYEADYYFWGAEK